ncbi:MAG: hypothetical protein AAGJ18_16145, partial [Bacteroidota bacterium]
QVGDDKGDLFLNIETICEWNKEEVNPLSGFFSPSLSYYKFSSPDCSDGVVFLWDDGFSAFQLSEGWQGKTKEGIQIGDSLNTFLTTYPDFEVDEENDLLYSREREQVNILAYFNEDQTLRTLRVER